MSETPENLQIVVLEDRITLLTARLEEAKQAVKSWVDANSSLSRSAAEERAKNQGAGRGVFGALMGPKYRAVARRAAAASNASISQDVAYRRSRIAEGKAQAQLVVRQIQAELSAAKLDLKNLTAGSRTRTRANPIETTQALTSLDLLEKLKQAKDQGLLTEAEFEEKRRKLVSTL
jgi:hypothetical protein